MLFDDPRVVHRVGDRRGVGLKRNENSRVPDRIDEARPGQLVPDRDRGDRCAAFEEGHDGAEDVSVGRLVEVLGSADLDGRGGGIPR